MKRFVLSCCILAATSTIVFAQAAKTHSQATSQSTNAAHAAFLGKVNEFEASASQNNMKAADDRFTDIKQMIVTDYHNMKVKITTAPNAAEKTKWTNLMDKKQAIYNDIISAASDMKGNYKVMVKKFKEYATTL